MWAEKSDLYKVAILTEPEVFKLAGLGSNAETIGLFEMDSWDHYIPTLSSGIGRRTFNTDLLKPNQSVEHALGAFAIASKRFSSNSLKRAFGPEIAATITPTSFSIPLEQEEFKKHLAHTNYAGVWALAYKSPRNASDIVFGIKAIDKLKIKQGDDEEGHVSAERVVTEQYRPLGRHPMKMRLYVVYMGGAGDSGVFRTYLCRGGFVDFGAEIPKVIKNESDVRSYDFTVSLTEEKDTPIWVLREFRQHLKTVTGSEEAFEKIWDEIQRSIVSHMAPLMPSLRLTAYKLRNYNGGNVGLLGFDVVLSSDLQPWISAIHTETRIFKSSSQCSYVDSNQTNCEFNKLDFEKIGLLKGYLKIVKARWNGFEKRQESVRNAIKGKLGSCPVDAELLSNVMVHSLERQEAEQVGFMDLTPMIYASLRCLQGDPNGCQDSLPQKPPFGSKVSTGPRSIPSNLIGYFQPTEADKIVASWMQIKSEPMSAAKTLARLCQENSQSKAARKQRDEL